mmetsp:Transcript_107303/g.213012  ORF Transcript_107303/g.213012 Transcript_107303/m.213012 type:complete len:246 (+) Transcript_107303:129-866(+)
MCQVRPQAGRVNCRSLNMVPWVQCGSLPSRSGTQRASTKLRLPIPLVGAAVWHQRSEDPVARLLQTLPRRLPYDALLATARQAQTAGEGPGTRAVHRAGAHRPKQRGAPRRTLLAGKVVQAPLGDRWTMQQRDPVRTACSPTAESDQFLLDSDSAGEAQKPWRTPELGTISPPSASADACRIQSMPHGPRATPSPILPQCTPLCRLPCPGRPHGQHARWPSSDAPIAVQGHGALDYHLQRRMRHP